MTASWRDSTKAQYSIYIKKWYHFCRENNINCYYAEVTDVLKFLSKLYHVEHAAYSTINQARSALSSFLTLTNTSCTVGTHPLVCRFLKGVFHLRTPLPRYKKIWDIGPVFRVLRNMSPANSLSLKKLTLKLCMIIALTSAQRIQSLKHMNLDHLKVTSSSVTFYFEKLLKQSRPGNVGFSVTVEAYPPDRRLCVVKYIKEYLGRTSTLRGNEKQLFISYKKPHKCVSSQTIARWLKDVLKTAGIDTDKYRAHSTRAASTSAANRGDVPVASILEQAGWASERTFRRFYNKPKDAKTSFSQAITHSADK